MKKASLFASAAMILATAAIASANPFADVPFSHWAYDAINSLSSKDIIQGFPNGTFKGNQNVTRYQLAMVVAKLVANAEQCGGNVAKSDLQTLEKLTVEFADELALLGVKVTALEDDMAVVKEDVAGLKKDVDGIKSYMANGGMQKVRLSGDMLVRHYDYNLKDVTLKEHRTETLLRLQMDAQIDERVSACARWNMIQNDGRNEWDGNNKGTGDVEVAFVKINDIFNGHGTLKLGRDWFEHGHGFVVHGYADAINWAKRCGDINVAYNMFYDRNRGNGADTHQIYNINFDYTTKNKAHDLYLGFYYNTKDTGVVNADKQKETRIEFGASGKLGKKDTSKWGYDLAAVYSKVTDNKINPVTGQIEDEKGWLGHVAVKYDSKKQLTAKLAYTFADEESNHEINAGNLSNLHDNRYCMGSETIFEDIATSQLGMGAWNLKNFNHFKAQVGYTFKNAEKHSLRLAYDMLKEKKDVDLGLAAGAAYDGRFGFYGYADENGKFKSDYKVMTFEYDYQLAENTRLRLVYQNAKSKTLADDVKTSLFFSEIYSKF